MKLVPIPECPFGREVCNWNAAEGDLRSELHEHGMLLFRGVHATSSWKLAEHVRRWFPSLEIKAPAANRPTDDGPVSVLGSTKDEDGRFNADYVPAATTGAPLLAADGSWTAELEASLTDWIQRKRECAFMEWHTDATFVPWPTSYAALYCMQPGSSATGFASATLGLQHLPADLRTISEQSICTYRPSIIYGNAELGIPAIASRSVQLAATRSGAGALPATEKDGNLETSRHPADPVVRHKLVQVHPHTGERSLRFSLKSLETLSLPHDAGHGDMAPTEGKRTAWQIMRHATCGEQAYLHRWRQGDLIIWDERSSMHCRVPYDAQNEIREMWRMVFRNDPADRAFNAATPQLNLDAAFAAAQ